MLFICWTIIYLIATLIRLVCRELRLRLLGLCPTIIIIIILLIENFSHKGLSVVIHRSLSDSKPLLVSGALLSILADFSNAVVRVVSIRPLISSYSTPFLRLLEIIPSTPPTAGMTLTLNFHIFLVLWQGLSTCRCFRFRLFLLCGLPQGKNPQDSKFFFCLVIYHSVWSSGWDLFVPQNNKEFFWDPIFLNDFWFVLIPFGSMV